MVLAGASVGKEPTVINGLSSAPAPYQASCYLTRPASPRSPFCTFCNSPLLHLHISRDCYDYVYIPSSNLVFQPQVVRSGSLCFSQTISTIAETGKTSHDRGADLPLTDAAKLMLQLPVASNRMKELAASRPWHRLSRLLAS